MITRSTGGLGRPKSPMVCSVLVIAGLVVIACENSDVPTSSSAAPTANSEAAASEHRSHTIFDAAHDFTISSNPNGVWSYGWTTSLGGPFILSTTGRGCCNEPGREGWLGPAENDPVGDAPRPWIETTSFTGPLGILESRPGPNGEFSVLRWTAPTTGKYDVLVASTEVFDECVNADLHILRSNLSVADGQVSCQYDIQALHYTALLHERETIDVVVGPGNDGFNDEAIHLKVTIAQLSHDESH